MLTELLKLFNGESAGVYNADFNLLEYREDGKPVFNRTIASPHKRELMPQLKGWPLNETYLAYELPKNGRGKVDATQYFMQYLERKYHCIIHPRDPETIWFSQDEVSTVKVAKHFCKMLADPHYKKFIQVYILCRDGVLLDGHHGIASVVAYNHVNAEEQRKVQTMKVDVTFDTLLKEACNFADILGIARKASGE